MTSLYETARPPLAVQTVESIDVQDPVQERAVGFRLQVPRDHDAHAVVVYSHGSFCGPATYDRITRAWAASGYAVVLPYHLDAPGDEPPAGPPDLALLLATRIRDLSFALDSLPELYERAGLSCSPGAQRVAAAGHSFGAMTALTKVGLKLKPGMYTLTDSAADDRFSVALSMSGVGLLPPMEDDGFSVLDYPLMATGGTRDEGNVGSGPVHPWEWRLAAYDLAPPGDKYRLVLDRGDHYLGGLIGRDGEGEQGDAEGLDIVARTTVAFFDAYLRNEAAARTWLAETDLGALTEQRASLTRK